MANFHLDFDVDNMDMVTLNYLKSIYSYDDYNGVLKALIGMYFNRLSPSIQKSLVFRAERLDKKYGIVNSKN